MKILAIGAHFDDIELGCGGSLLRWKSEGHSIHGLVASQSGYKDAQGKVIRSNDVARNEGRASAKLIGYDLIEGPFETFDVTSNEKTRSFLIQEIEKIQPDMILTHWPHDVHGDHRELSKATLHCAKRTKKILFYRSNWHLGDQPFDGRMLVDISKFFEKKIEAVSAHKSENERTMNQWLEWAKSSASLFGMTAGVKYAEAFQINKWIE